MGHHRGPLCQADKCIGSVTRFLSRMGYFRLLDRQLGGTVGGQLTDFGEIGTSF